MPLSRWHMCGTCITQLFTRRERLARCRLLWHGLEALECRKFIAIYLSHLQNYSNKAIYWFKIREIWGLKG
jgi:hypothetical protein